MGAIAGIVPHHVLLDGQSVLVDGRNRREACRRAGVIPDYVLLDGQDPVAYILSANINRRHMTKGQRAIVVAKIYPEPEKGGRGKNSSVTKEFSSERLSLARTVLRHAPDLAASVIAGSISLDNAYEEARIRKGRADTHEARFNALKEAAPDLAERVVEGKLSLEEAEAAERERQERIHRDKVLLAQAAPLPVIREQAERFRRYLADDSNNFDGAWLEKQQHRLDAVHSYVRNRQVRAEVSQCQRWVELRIGEWLGPAKTPEETGRGKSLPGNEINNRHKHEFRFIAEHKGIVTDIMKNNPGKEITRAMLIGAIEDALLVRSGCQRGE
jgi:hypothetical protein